MKKIVPKRGKWRKNRKILVYANVKKNAFDPLQRLSQMFKKEHQINFK